MLLQALFLCSTLHPPTMNSFSVLKLSLLSWKPTIMNSFTVFKWSLCSWRPGTNLWTCEWMEHKRWKCTYFVSSTTSTSGWAVIGVFEWTAVGSSVVWSSPLVELTTCNHRTDIYFSSWRHCLLYGGCLGETYQQNIICFWYVARIQPNCLGFTYGEPKQNHKTQQSTNELSVLR